MPTEEDASPSSQLEKLGKNWARGLEEMLRLCAANKHIRVDAHVNPETIGDGKFTQLVFTLVDESNTRSRDTKGMCMAYMGDQKIPQHVLVLFNYRRKRQ